MKCKIFNRLARARDTAKSSITHERRRRTRASERNLFSNPIPTWEIGVSHFQHANQKTSSSESILGSFSSFRRRNDDLRVVPGQTKQTCLP